MESSISLWNSLINFVGPNICYTVCHKWDILKEINAQLEICARQDIKWYGELYWTALYYQGPEDVPEDVMASNPWHQLDESLLLLKLQIAPVT